MSRAPRNLLVAALLGTVFLVLPSCDEEVDVEELELQGIDFRVGSGTVQTHPGCSNAPAFEYASQDLDECQLISIFCAPGSNYFQNACGCGCVGQPDHPGGGAFFCGGFGGFECPNDNMVCVDNPLDGCEPDLGGADCGGVCVGAGAG